MAALATFRAWAESLESLDYYEILRVDRNAPPAVIQDAFHQLSLRCHPDRFIQEGPEIGQAASAVFKRLVEAYGVLRRPNMRKRYDSELAAHGAKVAFDEHAAEKKPTFEQRTLFMIAQDPRAKKFAAKADTLIAAGKLEDARIQLISACQNEPQNEELKERLDILYEALALEPL